MDTFVPQRFGPRWQGVAVGRPGIEDALSMISTEPWIDRHGDSMWSFLAGSVVTAVVGFLFYYLGKRTKSLDSLPISATSILTIPSSEVTPTPMRRPACRQVSSGCGRRTRRPVRRDAPDPSPAAGPDPAGSNSCGRHR